MPADADLQCEYFLSSQLNRSKSHGEHRPTLIRNSNESKPRPFGPTASNFTQDNFEFVKYTKSGMSESLKRKYELLTGAHTTTLSSTTYFVPSASSALSPTPIQANGGMQLANSAKVCIFYFYFSVTLFLLRWKSPVYAMH